MSICSYNRSIATKPASNGLHLHNSLSKQLEPFVHDRSAPITMYTCGPTVYGRPHIGNYSSLMMADLLRRWLEVSGYTVTQAKNITDVGHLVRDADEGEDKIEKQAREEHGSVTHESVIKVARMYEEQYLEDERTLNFLEPAFRPRASEYVEQMKDMIETLLKDEIAYITDDGLYFDVSKFDRYGKLSGNTLDNISAGARVAINDAKKHAADFALWKFCVGNNAHHALRWQSPGANNPEGFPGWHIECSAMARELLGDTIDIHTGGEDNIFPHHECEIAQSESVTHQPFVRYWIHKRMIDLEGTKMSKSLGNGLNIPSILERGYDPMDIRYYLLSVHYRTNLQFSWKGMDDSKKARRKIVEWMEEVEKSEAGDSCNSDQHDAIAAHYGAFRDAMNNDLNTSGALAAIFDLMNWSRTTGPLCADTKADLHMIIAFIRHTFGCFDAQESTPLPSEIASLVAKRQAAREAKNFTESDRLRGEIEAKGYELKDTNEGQQVRKM